MNIDELIPIKTDRLLLGGFKPEDWKDFLEIEQSPEQHKYNFETYNPRSKEEIIKYIIELSEQNYNDLKLPFLLAIRMIENSQLIGFIGFKNGSMTKQGQIEVYYSLYKSFWNKGFGTEALNGIIKFGFDIIKLHKIFAGCDIDNFASMKIMEKAGMRFESRWRKDRIRNEQWTDGLGFAILEEDLCQM
jgi:RimJ/RimL family protein N-acetyltransferase